MHYMGFQNDSWSENVTTEHTSWCERMGSAICGSVIGFFLFFGGLSLVGWNEYRTIETVRVIAAGEKAVVEGSCKIVRPTQDEALVHVSCPITNIPTLAVTSGKDTWVSEQTIWLEAHAEYFAWHEAEDCTTKKTQGGGTDKTCTYSYSQKWMKPSVRDPTTWTILQKDGPNHLGSRYIALPDHQNSPNHLGLCALQLNECALNPCALTVTTPPSTEASGNRFACPVDFSCTDPDNSVTDNYVCECPTCVDSVLTSGSAGLLTDYFGSHPAFARKHPANPASQF